MDSTYSQVLNLFATLLLASGLLIVTGRRMTNLIKGLALQAWLIAGSALIVALASGVSGILIAGLLTLVVKGIAIPWILFFIIKKLNIKSQVEPYVKSGFSLVIACVLILLAYGAARPVINFGNPLTEGFLPVSLALIMIGLFVMVTRKKAVSQIVGLLMMENGMYLAAISLTYGMPLVVELGIFLDILVGVLIMGVLVYQINATFESINTEHLKSLKG